MLEVGNGELTLEECRTHFALWAAMKSPVGEPATPYKWGRNPNWTWNSSWPAEYWSGKSSDGTMVLMMNTEDEKQFKIADWGEIPGLKAGAGYNVIDAWTGKTLGCQKDGVNASVPAHDTAVLLVQDECSQSDKRDAWWNKVLRVRFGTWIA